MRYINLLFTYLLTYLHKQATNGGNATVKYCEWASFVIAGKVYWRNGRCSCDGVVFAGNEWRSNTNGIFLSVT